MVTNRTPILDPTYHPTGQIGVHQVVVAPYRLRCMVRGGHAWLRILDFERLRLVFLSVLIAVLAGGSWRPTRDVDDRMTSRCVSGRHSTVLKLTITSSPVLGAWTPAFWC